MVAAKNRPYERTETRDQKILRTMSATAPQSSKKATKIGTGGHALSYAAIDESLMEMKQRDEYGMLTSSKDGALLKTVDSSFKSPYQTVDGEEDESGRPTIRMEPNTTYRTARTLGKMQDNGSAGHHARNRTISNEPES